MFEKEYYFDFISYIEIFNSIFQA